jgi:hypothetical protein
MTTLSSMSASPAFNTSRLGAAMPSAAPGKTTVADPATPASIVTLSRSNPATSSQDMPGILASATNPLVWETKSDDPLSYLMAHNYASQTPADRFAGLGAAMLDQFKGDGTDISQSVRQGLPGTQLNPYGGVVSIRPPSLHGIGDNQITLSITTKSGIEVSLSLDSQKDSLAVQMKSSGKLSDTERSALADLAKEFQDAIDGIASQQPNIKLDGLTQFDSNVLASVDFHANVRQISNETQSLDFHADATQRTVSLNGPAGAAKVSVDLSKPASWGSQAQQAKAMNNYLKQFDQAASRGNGNASLTTMFKDAFSEMNSNYGPVPQPRIGMQPPISLGDEDHAMLTGLADFSASVTQTQTSPNPMRPGEKDSFAYQASQSTDIQGLDQSDRAISQTQQSTLQASYHRSIAPLDSTRESQNYSYYTIDDTATSAVDMAYKKGVLVKASLSQSASQSTRVQKYVLGHLTDDTTTPSEASLTQDLVKALMSDTKSNESRTASEIDQRKQMLSAINDMIFLQSNPARLNDETQAQTKTAPIAK